VNINENFSYAFNSTALEFSQRNRLLLAARNALLTFRRSVPASLNILISAKASTLSCTPRSALFFQMSYQMSLLLIHQPYLRERTESTSFRLAPSTMTVAASNMTRYIHPFQKYYARANNFSLINDLQPPLPTFVIHHILTGCIMHLLNGTSNNEHHKAMC
jgi:hypothetical protein